MKKQLFLGRDTECDIPIMADRGVSRTHAVLQHVTRSTVESLIDLDSTAASTSTAIDWTPPEHEHQAGEGRFFAGIARGVLSGRGARRSALDATAMNLTRPSRY